MSGFRLRAFEPRDAPAVRAIQVQTMVLGDPLPFPVADLERLLDYYLDYYLTAEPRYATVGVDATDRLVGYFCGSVNPGAQARWQRRAALRLAARWAVRWRRHDAFTRWFYRLRLAEARAVLRQPAPPAPAHVHFNLLPEARGPLWKAFVRRFLEQAGEVGVGSFAGEISVRHDRRDGAAFLRAGFRLAGCMPNLTLTAIRGEPVWRLTVIADAATMLSKGA